MAWPQKVPPGPAQEGAGSSGHAGIIFPNRKTYGATPKKKGIPRRGWVPTKGIPRNSWVYLGYTSGLG